MIRNRKCTDPNTDSKLTPLYKKLIELKRTWMSDRWINEDKSRRENCPFITAVGFRHPALTENKDMVGDKAVTTLRGSCEERF